jgi:hypothetical protein
MGSGLSAPATPPRAGKPAERMLVSLEYAQGVGDSRRICLKLGHAW